MFKKREASCLLLLLVLSVTALLILGHIENNNDLLTLRRNLNWGEIIPNNHVVQLHCFILMVLSQHASPFDSSVGRAEDCSGYIAILRSLVRIRLEGEEHF